MSLLLSKLIRLKHLPFSRKSLPGPILHTAYYASVQKRVQSIVDSGHLFFTHMLVANAYWGHPRTNYPLKSTFWLWRTILKRLTGSGDATKIHTIFGGKNPHPNFVVGGVPMPIDLNSDTALNAERLSIISDSIDKMIQSSFDQVYLP